MTNTTRRRVLAVFAAALAAGCTSLPPKVEAPTLYTLAPSDPPIGARRVRDEVLEVAAPRAWPGYDTPAMVYVKSPYALDHYAASRWADTPARMLGPLVGRALQRAGGFRAVVQPPSPAAADLRLDVELMWLRQSFATTPSRAEIALRVQLVDVKARRVIAGEEMVETEPSASENAAGGVAAANAALARLVERIVAFCDAAVPPR